MRSRWLLWLLLGMLVGVVCYGTGAYFAARKYKNFGFVQSLISRGKLGAVISLIDKSYVDSVEVSDLEEQAIVKLVAQLDPHSEYIPAREAKAYKEPLLGGFEGVGITFNMQTDTLLVLSTVVGGPSEKVGILSGDRIIRVNGVNVAGVKFPQDSLMQMLRGPRGTQVAVRVNRSGVEDPLDFTITREKIPINSVGVAYMVDSLTGYIHLVRFSQTTPQEFATALSRLAAQGMQRIVVDLRGNGGGLLDAAVFLSEIFLPQGTLIVYTEGRASPRRDFVTQQNGILRNIPLAVLIDDASASASEIFAGAIQDNDRGFVVGRRSFGKGLVQEQFPFRDGSLLHLTVARYYTPSGRCIQRPYELGNDSLYYVDYFMRFQRGEFTQRDSVHLDSLARYTTIGGRTVYGGGGIMPDIFVPVDTMAVTPYYTSVLRRNLPFRFAVRFVDRHRSLLQRLDGIASMRAYFERAGVLKSFVDFASQEGVAFVQSDYEASKALLEGVVYSQIARFIWENNGFYPFLQPTDEVLNTAIEVLSTQQVLPGGQ